MSGDGTQRRVAIALHGALGRMGQRIVACAAGDHSLHIVSALDRGDLDGWIAGPDEVDLILDFSSDAGAQLSVRAALAKQSALLVGTTALSAETRAALTDAAKTIPILIAPNTSLGIALARHLVRQAASLLGPEFDIEIVERHHRHKVDAPSGTAISLAEASADAGRPIRRDQIHAQRLGDVIGEHVVTFAGPGEILEIRHAATNRDLFARGALRLGVWLVGRGPGLHTVDAWIAEQSHA